MDAYLVAASLPVLVSGTVGAAISYSMVPALITHRSNNTENAEGFPAALGLCMLMLGTVISLGGIIFAKTLLIHFVVGFDCRIAEDTIYMARISWITAGIAVPQAFLIALNNFERRFYLPIMAGTFPYLGMIAFGLILSRSLGTVSIAWGMLFGTLLSCVVMWGGNVSVLVKSTIRTSDWNDVFGYLKDTPLILVAMVCFTVYQAVDAYWAPRLGVGNMSYLGYCQRLLIAIGNLVIAGPSVVLVPRLTEAHIEGRQYDFLNDLARALRMVIAIALPVAVMISILAVPLVQLLFQRGAFDAVATRGVADILPFMMVGMVGMLCVVIIFRALYARGQFSITALLGAMSVTFYFTLSGLLSGPFLIKGIAFAYALSWWVVFVIAVMQVWKESQTANMGIQQWQFLWRLGLASIIMGTFIKYGADFLVMPFAASGTVNFAFRMCAVSVFGFAVFCVMTRTVFRIDEIRQITSILSSRLFSRGQLD
jgi:putative peptidoglycan lipid II flippase